MRENIITQYFEEVETTKEYNGYFCSIAETVTTVISGSICGLKNISRIHQWADSSKVKEFLKEKSAIDSVPCYYWLLCLLKLVKPKSLDRCFMKWVGSMMPEEREGLKCIGAVHTEFEEKGKKSSGWHYYISSRELTARELLHHSRMEWCVETMHWLLDVHFGEDGCRVEDKNIQQNLNMLRKLAVNLIKKHKENSGSKRAISKIMFDCLLGTSYICEIMEN